MTSAPSSTTSVPLAGASSRTNDVSASFGASRAPDAVATGTLSGVLAPGQTLAVPLSGPGAWTLHSSEPIATQLSCPAPSAAGSASVLIVSAQTCQLLLSSASSTSSQWRLAPGP